MTKEIRRNRFNGESVELTAAEAEKHDKIFYHEAMATLEDQSLGTGANAFSTYPKPRSYRSPARLNGSLSAFSRLH